MPRLRLYNKIQVPYRVPRPGDLTRGPSTPALGSLSFPVSVCIFILLALSVALFQFSVYFLQGTRSNL